MLKFVRITEQDFDLVKGINLREADKVEITTASGMPDVQDALRDCIRNSSEWAEAAFLDGKCVALFGLGCAFGNIGVPWCVGSPEIMKKKHLFSAYSKRTIRIMLEQFPLLANYVDARNKSHVFWLMRVGFIFPEGVGCRIGGYWFHYFYKERD